MGRHQVTGGERGSKCTYLVHVYVHAHSQLMMYTINNCNLVLSFPLRISMNFVSFSVFASWKRGADGEEKSDGGQMKRGIDKCNYTY